MYLSVDKSRVNSGGKIREKLQNLVDRGFRRGNCVNKSEYGSDDAADTAIHLLVGVGTLLNICGVLVGGHKLLYAESLKDGDEILIYAHLRTIDNAAGVLKGNNGSHNRKGSEQRRNSVEEALLVAVGETEVAVNNSEILPCVKLAYGLAVLAERSRSGIKSRNGARASLLVQLGGEVLGSLCNKATKSADKREQLLGNESYGFIGVYLLVEYLGNSALGNLQNGEKNIFNSADRSVD